MDRGELLTPLLAQHLQKKFNVVAVSQCGRSSGPKYGQNLLDIATGMTSLSTPFVHSNAVGVGIIVCFALLWSGLLCFALLCSLIGNGAPSRLW